VLGPLAPQKNYKKMHYQAGPLCAVSLAGFGAPDDWPDIDRHAPKARALLADGVDLSQAA